MKERGIDISAQHSKGLEDVPLEDMDYIINMSGRPSKALPIREGDAVILDWQIDDPIGFPLARYRQTRDDIDRRVGEFIKQMWKSAPTPGDK